MFDPISTGLLTSLIYELTKKSIRIAFKKKPLEEALKSAAKKSGIYNKKIINQIKDFILAKNLSPLTFDKDALLKALKISEKNVDEFLSEFKVCILKNAELAHWLSFEYLDSAKEERSVIIQEIKKLRSEFQKVILEKIRLKPCLNNQTPPESNFVGQLEFLRILSEWWENPKVKLGAIIGWGGVGKSALIRKWYDLLDEREILPVGLFWWGFYRNNDIDLFIDTLLGYVSRNLIDASKVKNNWEKIKIIKTFLIDRNFLFIFDGFEEMQDTTYGSDIGRIKYKELVELLHYFADLGEGLCLITTRFPLKDLAEYEDSGFSKIELLGLSEKDSIAMLKKREIKGSHEELAKIAKNYAGHALCLTLLAGYLKKYHKGNVESVPKIQYLFKSSKRFKNVNYLLDKYKEKLRPEEYIFLNIFSLFQSEVREMDFDNVFKFKFKKSDYNRPLIELSNLDFIDLCESFIDCRLIYGDEQRETFTAHPLVKTYFEINFNNEHKILFHRRIYEYLDEISKLKPKTLEEMRPVFEQIYHGCQARMYNKAYEVYSKKIQRGDKYFLLYELDAWNSCIKVLENFFNNKTIQHNAIIPSIKNKGEILCTAGLAMRMTNRFSEAKTLYKEAIKADIDRKDWENAAIDYQNLAHLQIIEAELINSIDSSKKAIELSRSAKNKNREWRATAWLAYTLFLAGKMEEALEKYEYANKLVKKSEPSLKYIYSGWGVRYSDFLLAKGEIENALNVTLENLNVCKKRKWISYVNFCHYSLAAIYRHQNKLEKAEDEILLAIGSSRYSGDRDRATEYFIELAKIRIDQRSYEDAIDILKEALLTCEKNSYCLLQIEAELLLAESYFEISNFRESKKLAKSAFLNAEKSNYYWVKIKSEGLLKRLK